MDKLPHIEAAHAEHAKAEGYLPKDSEWEANYAAFIKQYYPDRFSSFREFTAAATVRKRLTDAGVWQETRLPNVMRI
eukprot:3850346-Alexandrium_andersonii.AAC.1